MLTVGRKNILGDAFLRSARIVKFRIASKWKVRITDAVAIVSQFKLLLRRIVSTISCA